MNEIKSILMDVQKPGRYVGGERNCCIKNKNDVDIRFAFCFPDVYEVGMSHLGLKILYSVLNERQDIWCERVFAPWVDMEEKMRENSIPLYGIESKDPLSEFDFISFTLQYELSYTNILNMLDLAGIPLFSKDRNSLKNIVVAGGPCAYNPEPLAEFIDLFFIGEGEEVLLEAIDIFRECKNSRKSKEEFLKRVSLLDGVYVPGMCNVDYKEDGTIKSFNGPIVTKRIMKNLDKAHYPSKFIVPMIEIVHDRIVEEILRGCIRGCRFCQAGFVYRPYREKSCNVINEQCKSIFEFSGYDEISLSSLSSNDYSKINGLIDLINSWGCKRKMSVSLPSMRVDNFSHELMTKLKMIRKSGLTFAVEAGTQRLRDVINKNVKSEDLFNAIKIAKEGGFSKVKLYFMIGLPTETYEDILEISNIANDMSKIMSVTVSASSFVPKPFTPFQWEPQDSVESLKEKQYIIKSGIKSRKASFKYHECFASFLEGVFSRGDRKLCKVLYRAHKNGCKFDGWSDFLNFEKWMSIFKECSIDPDFYTSRRRSFDEILPWDHIDCGVKKSFLKKECERAYKGLTTQSCRESCSFCGVAKFGSGICNARG